MKKRIIALVLATVVSVGSLFTENIIANAANVPTTDMWRVYNPNSGEHLYTSDRGEADHLSAIGWSFEGKAWNAPDNSNTPVYRLYNPNSGEHHYTTNEVERDSLSNIGWKYEGIGWYSDDSKGVPLYRLYNPNATGQYEAGAHHYTANITERNQLISIGWSDEGIGWYGTNTEAAEQTPNEETSAEPSTTPTPTEPTADVPTIPTTNKEYSGVVVLKDGGYYISGWHGDYIPAEYYFVNSRGEDGGLIQTMTLVEGTGCPSETEGHWEETWDNPDFWKYDVENEDLAISWISNANTRTGVVYTSYIINGVKYYVPVDTEHNKYDTLINGIRNANNITYDVFGCPHYDTTTDLPDIIGPHITRTITDTLPDGSPVDCYDYPIF